MVFNCTFPQVLRRFGGVLHKKVVMMEREKNKKTSLILGCKLITISTTISVCKCNRKIEITDADKRGETGNGLSMAEKRKELTNNRICHQNKVAGGGPTGATLIMQII